MLEKVLWGIFSLFVILTSYSTGFLAASAKFQKEMQKLREEVRGTYSFLRAQSIAREQELFRLLIELNEAGVRVDKDALERIKKDLEHIA